jgi:hypothetical protein
MPYDPTSATFFRAFRFVDARQSGDDITRTDLDVALDDLSAGVNSSLQGGVSFMGEWDASIGAFPSERLGGGAVRARDAWRISVGGEIDGVPFVAGEYLQSLVAAPGQEYDSRWIRLDGLGFATATQILANTQQARDDAILARDSAAESAVIAATIAPGALPVTPDTPITSDGSLTGITVLGVYTAPKQIRLWIGNSRQPPENNFYTVVPSATTTSVVFAEAVPAGLQVSYEAVRQIASPVADPDAISFPDGSTALDLWQGVKVYASRAEMEAANIAAPVMRIGYIQGGRVYWFLRDAAGTAATTADGGNWSPDGDVYPDHFADNTIPGTTDMSAALLAACQYVASLSLPVDHGGGTVHVTGKTAIASEVNVVGNNITISGDGRAGTQIVPTGLTGNVIKFGSELAGTSYDCAIKDLKFVVPPNTVRTSGAFVQFRNVTGGGSFNVDYSGFYGAIDIVGSAHLIISNTWMRGRNRNGVGNVAKYCVQVDDDPVTLRGSTGIYISKMDGIANNSITNGWVEDFLIVRSCDGLYITDFHANLAQWAVTLAPHDSAFLGEFRMQGFYLDKSAIGNFRIVGNTTQAVRTVNLSNGLMRAAGGGGSDITTTDASAIHLDVGADGLDLFTMVNVRIDAPQGRAINTLTTNIRDQSYIGCTFEDINEGDNVGFNELELLGGNIHLDNTTFIRGSASTAASINSVTNASLKTGVIYDYDSLVTSRVSSVASTVEQGVAGWSGYRIPTSNNWDSVAKNKLMVNTDSSAIGVPTAVSSWHGLTMSQGDTATQMALRPDDFRFRRKTSGIWGLWRRIITDIGLVGTVSQSSGLPTGAVFEHGSNANGEYTRFADGTMVCTKRIQFLAQDITTPFGSLYQSANLITGAQTYASAFIAVPTFDCTVHCVTDAVFEGISGTGSTTATPSGVYALSPVSLTNKTLYLNITATGRWF